MAIQRYLLYICSIFFMGIIPGHYGTCTMFPMMPGECDDMPLNPYSTVLAPRMRRSIFEDPSRFCASMQ